MWKSSRRLDARAQPVFALEGRGTRLYLGFVPRLGMVAATTADLDLDDRTVTLKVRRSQRAHLLLRVDAAGDKVELVLPRGVSLQELVNGLNALGIGPRDMISILQTIKAAGALQAEIQVM